MTKRGIVEKRGGTSLASAMGDKDALAHIVQTHRQEVDPQGYTILVCSGVGKKDNTRNGRKATDHAIDIVNGVDRDNEWGILQEMLRKNVYEHGLVQEIIDPYIHEVNAIIESGNIDGEAKSKIIWLPERCKQRTLFEAATRLHTDVAFVMVDYFENGMIGIDSPRHINVPVHHQKTLEHIPLLAKHKDLKGKIAIMGGFGGTRGGTQELVTLERGMSDGTATYWGAALYCDEVRIFSDQDGILPVDPQIITGLEPIGQATYREAEAFAGLGAQIMNDVALRPARERGILVRVLNSFNESHFGTAIWAFPPSLEHYGVKAIAHVPGYYLMTVYSMRMNEKGIAARVAKAFAEHGFSIDSEIDGDSCRTYAIKCDGDLSALCKLLEKNGHRVSLMNKMSRIALVGEGMNALPKNGEKTAEEILYGTLKNQRIPLKMYSHGQDSVIRSVFIQEEYTHQAITHLYRALGFHREK